MKKISDFVGMKLEEVKKMEDLNYRITSQDGVEFAGTCDVRPGRYNFTVEKGVITSVKMG